MTILWRDRHDLKIYNADYIKKDILEDLYINLELSTHEIANNLGIHYSTVKRYLIYYNIIKPTLSEELNYSPNRWITND